MGVGRGDEVGVVRDEGCGGVGDRQVEGGLRGAALGVRRGPGESWGGIGCSNRET